MDDVRKELLKPMDIAPLLGVHKTRVYHLIRSGELPAVEVGGAWRIPRKAWEAWLEKQNEQALSSLRAVEAHPAPDLLGVEEAREEAAA